MRILEQKKEEEEKQLMKYQYQIEKCTELTKRSNRSLQQLHSNCNANQIKQEQQLDNLVGTLNLLKQRMDVILPRFDEISELKKINETLKQRIDHLTSQSSTNDNQPSILPVLQKRVNELEKRVFQLSGSGSGSGSNRLVSPPPPRPSSPPPIPPAAIGRKNKETSSTEQVEEDKHFMPKLRKAFAAPKLPSFVLKALHGKSNQNVDTVICTLPPYAKM